MMPELKLLSAKEIAVYERFKQVRAHIDPFVERALATIQHQQEQIATLEIEITRLREIEAMYEGLCK